MAIRIDLLPGYVGLRRWFKRILVGCVALIGVFAAVLFLLYYRDQLALQTLKTNRQNIEAFAQKTEAAEKAKADAEAQARPMQDAVSFFVDAGRSGSERAALLYLIHRYIYADAELKLLDLSDGQNAKMEARVASPDKYANFLMRLRNGTVPTGVLFKNLPSGAGIKGYPDESGANAQQGGQAGAPDMVPTAAGEPGAEGQDTGMGMIRYRNLPNSISINAALNEPVVVPAPPGGAPAPAAAGDPMAGDPGAPPAP